MSEIVKKPTSIVDNFEGWDDSVEGDDRPQGGGVIQGILVKFTNEAEWITRDGGSCRRILNLLPLTSPASCKNGKTSSRLKPSSSSHTRNFPTLRR